MPVVMAAVVMRVTAVIVVVMVLHKLGFNLLRLAAAFELEHRAELVRLGQFVGGFEVIALLFDPKRLSLPAVAERFQRHSICRERLRLVAVLIEEIEAEARRHIRLEHAQLNAANGRCNQRSAVWPVRLAFEMVVVLTAVVVRVIVVVVMMIVTGMIVPVAVGMGVFVGMTVPAMIVFMSVRVLVSVVVAMRPVHVE